MTTFFIDLWQDLREKRLWPVAVGLLAAMAAVPVVLFKPAGEAPLPTVATNTSSPELLPVVSVDDGPKRGSNLEAFAEKDPFTPLKDVEKDPASSGSGSGSAGSSAAGSAGGSTGSPLGSAAGAPGGGSAGSPGGGGSTGGGIQYYRYTVDVELGERGQGKAKRIEGVKQTQLLPDGQTPVLAYMGMADDARTAVFFIIDPAYTAQGEGKCRPRGSECRFIYLGVNQDGNEESIFTADGESEYTLKLLKINRETISPSQAKGHSQDSKPSAKSARKPVAKGKDIQSLLDLPALLAKRR